MQQQAQSSAVTMSQKKQSNPNELFSFIPATPHSRYSCWWQLKHPEYLLNGVKKSIPALDCSHYLQLLRTDRTSFYSRGYSRELLFVSNCLLYTAAQSAKVKSTCNIHLQFQLHIDQRARPSQKVALTHELSISHFCLLPYIFRKDNK